MTEKVQKIEDKKLLVEKVLRLYGLYKKHIEFILDSDDLDLFFNAISNNSVLSYKFPGEEKPFTYLFSDSLGSQSNSDIPVFMPSKSDIPQTPKRSAVTQEYKDREQEEYLKRREQIKQREDDRVLKLYAEKKEPMVVQTFSISKADKEQLQALADRQERSLGSLIRLVLKKHLKDFAHLHNR